MTKMKFLLALVFLALLELSVAYPRKQAPGKNSTSNHTGDEWKCFNVRKVLYNGDCHELLSRGPCQEGEWLALDLASAPSIRPKCQVRHCVDSDFVYWPKDQKCYRSADQKLCNKPNTTLNYDAFGLGACMCKGGIPRAMSNNGTCYPLYSRGPCKQNYIFVENPKGEAVCVPNPCPDYGMLYYAPKHKCYPIDQQGPCEKEMSLVVDITIRKPACNNIQNELHLVDVPNSCDSTDLSGKCASGVQIQPQGEQYVSQLLLAGSKRRKRGTTS